MDMEDFASENYGYNNSDEGRESYLVDGDLAREYLSIFTDTDQSYESFLTTANVACTEAVGMSIIMEKDFSSRESKLNATNKIIETTEGLSQEDANRIFFALEGEESQSFLKKAWEGLKKIVRKLIIAIGNFLRSIVNYVKGAACKAQAYFFKTKMTGAVAAAKKTNRTVNMKSVNTTTVFKNASPAASLGLMLTLTKGIRTQADMSMAEVNKIMDGQVLTAKGGTMTDAGKASASSRVTKTLINDIVKDFAGYFAKQPGFDSKGAMTGALPKIREYVDTVLYGTAKPTKNAISYATLLETYGKVYLSDTFLASVNQISNDAKTSNKSLTKILGNIAKAESKLLKAADKKTQAKDIMRAYSKIKDYLQFITAITITFYGDVLSFRFRLYGIATKLVGGKGGKKKEPKTNTSDATSA